MKKILNLLFSIFLIFITFSCNFFADGYKDNTESEKEIKCTSIRLSSQNMNVKVGEIAYIAVSFNPSNATGEITWDYDKEIIEVSETSNGLVITGKKEGQTPLTATKQNMSATCIIKVAGYSENYVDTTEPYIYSSSTIIQLDKGSSQRISVSLFNGTAADIDGYTWTVDNSLTATINPNGQYCVVNGITDGYCRIKVTHTKAAYPYYIGVYVFSDLTKTPYLTTSNNIITLNKHNGEKNVSVNVINSAVENYSSGYVWEITSGDSNCVSYTANGENCVIKPLQSGTCTLSVKNEMAGCQYPLEIIIRVIEIVQNVYIQPSESIVILNNKMQHEISAELIGLNEGSQYSPEDFTWTISEKNESKHSINAASFADKLYISAINNGSASITISHPYSERTRQILVIVEGIEDSDNDDDNLKDSSCYITTSQNYIKTKVGADDTILSVSLKGGTAADSQNYTWEVINSPEDGSSEVITLTTSYGNVHSRMADSTYNFATAVIHPNAVGTATIKITNEKCYYPTEILVKVLSEDALLETPLELSGTSLISFLNSESKTYTVNLRGSQKVSGDENNITWSCDNNNLVINSNADTAVLTSNTTGNNVFTLNISHPKVQYTKKVMVITADTEEELNNIRVFYSDKSYYALNVNSSQSIIVNHYGFKGEPDPDTGDLTEFSWEESAPFVTWTSSNNNVCNVAKNNDYPLSAEITGVSSGNAKITVSYENVSFIYDVTVYPEGVNIGEVEQTRYLTTSKNVINLSSSGASTTCYVNGVGFNSSDLINLSWTVEDVGIATVVGNGESATITAAAEGETKIFVSHPDSENVLTIYIRVGSEYVPEITDVVPSIECINILTMLTSEPNKTFKASLNNYSGNSDFSFSINGTSVAQITSQSKGGTCVVSPVGKGNAIITVSNDKTLITKEVIVLVAETQEELSQMLKSLCYLSVSSNYVVLAEGGFKSVNISAVNLEPSKINEIEWICNDSSVALVTGNGSNATIQGLSNGNAVITVSQPDCINELKIYVYVDETLLVSGVERVKYISTNTEMILLTKDSPVYSLTATLTNGTEEENIDGFVFEIDDNSVATIISQTLSGKAYIRPIKAGQAEITIQHPSSSFPKKILVVIGNTAEELAEFKYLTTSSNVITIAEGTTRSVTCTVQNANGVVIDGFKWLSANPIYAGIAETTSGTAVITGNSIGTTKITVTNDLCTYPLEIIVQVISANAASAFPYIQVPNPILNLTVSTNWTNITAELIGGNDSDSTDFIWTAVDSDIIDIYGQNDIGKVRAKAAGITYITITHPKAVYSQQILCICDDVAQSECSISVSSGNIISMKPTANDQTITATLVNGSTTDKYNFTWQLDVYDIVDLVYNANTAIITPIKEGCCTLTVSHPKSAFNQSIVIKVQEYDTFAFTGTNKTITQGKTAFVTMQIPVSSVETKVSYSSKNENIVRIEGTNSVCQLTGIGEGTTSVHADLIAVATNTVLASSDLLVYVEAAETAINYITTNSTVFSMEKGTNKFFSVSLVGPDITATDIYNLQWKSSNDKVLKLSGASSTGIATGSQVYCQAVGSGECTLTVSHEKCNSDLTMYIIVPSESTKEINLSKTHISIDINKSVELKASITGGNSDDYKGITWTIDKKDSEEIAQVLGSGQTVSIYGLKAGTTTLHATTKAGSTAECQIVVNPSKDIIFDKTSITIAPGESKDINYTVSPVNSTVNLSAMFTNNIEYFSYTDNGFDKQTGKGSITVVGITTGGDSVNSATAALVATTNYSSKTTLSVTVSWNYSFVLSDSATYTITPGNSKTVTFTYNPVNAKIKVYSETYGENICTTSYSNGTGKVVITPTEECSSDKIIFAATNPQNNATFSTQKVVAKYEYKSVTVVPSLTSNGANRSKLTDGVIVLADGETANITFNIKEAGSSATITNISFKQSAKQGDNETITAVPFITSKKVELSSPDVTREVYWINDVYYPIWAAEEEYDHTIPADWRTEFSWCTDTDAQIWSDNGWGLNKATRYFKYIGLISNKHSVVDIDFDNGKSRGSSDPGSYTHFMSEYDTKYKWVMWKECQDNEPDKGIVWNRNYIRYGSNTIEELHNTEMEISELQSIPLLYCPGITYENLNWPEGLTYLCDAEIRPTKNTSLVKTYTAGVLNITVNHNSKTETYEYLVKYEQRNCCYDTY